MEIYGLVLRMLCNREDEEDATQEVLVRIVIRLFQFDFRSKLKNCAYRVAVKHILDVRKSALERLHLSVERFAEDLTDSLDLEAAAFLKVLPKWIVGFGAPARVSTQELP